MAFPWVAAIGMGAEALGSHQAGEATVEGAEAQAQIEALNRAYQEKIFNEEMARLQPRSDTATGQALPLFQQYIDQGSIDQTQMPLYNMQMGAGQDFLREQGMDNPYSMNRFSEGLNAAENDAGYARLQDMLQIGMGASNLAGQGAQNFATGQANSLMTGGNALTQGSMQSGNMNNSMYSNLAGGLGQIPAYMSQQQQPPPTLYGPQLPQGGIR